MNLKKSSSAVYWQFLDKNFKQLICSQGVETGHFQHLL